MMTLKTLTAATLGIAGALAGAPASTQSLDDFGLPFVTNASPIYSSGTELSVVRLAGRNLRDADYAVEQQGFAVTGVVAADSRASLHIARVGETGSALPQQLVLVISNSRGHSRVPVAVQAGSGIPPT